MGATTASRAAAWGLAGVLLLALGGRGAAAFEFLDGDLEVHGFFEEQIRVLGQDLDPSDDLDLAQWYHVLNVEIEWDIARSGWGPFDLVSAFARLEGRYDCVWTRGCGMLRTADTYGDRARHLPNRVSDARRAGLTGTVFTGDVRRRHTVPREAVLDLDPGPGTFLANVPLLDFPFKDQPVPHRRRPAFWFDSPVLDDLFNNPGVDGKFGVPPELDVVGSDPAPFYYEPVIRNCKYSFRGVPGPENGVGTQPGVWNPGCHIRTLGTLRFKPNPVRAADLSPITGEGGVAEFPFRPAPLFAFDDPSAPAAEAQGVFYPNAAVRRLMQRGEFDAFDQNFRQAELEWNRGASQQDEKELKEIYLDFELFDSRLWIRAGKQNIVWGKTELFRTTDQFNPQDIALATLAELEESRIALWSVRGVWSFYEVGPLEDVRLELALNYDQFEPTDLGRCGEPFAPNPVCTKTFGLLLHGVFGEGLAGEIRPPDPWNDLKGLEVGARVEWRWGRFSFQLADFYGYDDFPYLDLVFPYERNVDPETSRPRRAFARGSCVTGTEPDCLGVVSSPASPSGNVFTDGNLDGLPDRNPDGTIDYDLDDDGKPDVTMDALLEHHANIQIYAAICATSIGFLPALDVRVCGQTVLNSPNLASQLFRISHLLGASLAGSPIAANVLGVGLMGGVAPPLIQLNEDPNDDPLGIDLGANLGPNETPNPFALNGEGLAQRLTAQQEAVLGCGPLFGTHCDDDGVDLLNAEASALIQSWAGFEGTTGEWRMDLGDPALDLDGDGIPAANDPDDGIQAMPGTVGFVGGSPCLRYENGTAFILPGCRGPDYEAATLSSHLAVPVVGDYDPDEDGCARDDGSPQCAGARTLAIPYMDLNGDSIPDFGASTGQVFVSELAAFSWNAMMGLGVGLSSPTDYNQDGTIQPEEITIDDFDPQNPLRLDGCSFLRPQYCSTLQGLLLTVGVTRDTLRAGGNGRFGRADFLWHGGASAVLRYQKRNMLGFALDFAEDVTKSNWSAEISWIEGLPFRDHDAFDNLTTVDTYNLTVSADRPTFINFLNPNRTFFFNTQWFFQYADGYSNGFTSNGPFNVLFTFTVDTGYFDDRLQPRMTWVYDFRSNSGGGLPRITYRFTSNFSATFGLNFFWGRFETKHAPLTQIVLGKRAGKGANSDFVENALSVVNDRDEVYLRIRYTF